jgi:hypothetical protein
MRDIATAQPVSIILDSCHGEKQPAVVDQFDLVLFDLVVLKGTASAVP